MKVELSYEITCFLFAISEGILAGFFYDMAKSFRCITRKGTLADIIFWALLIFSCTKIWQIFQNGEVRFFMIFTALLSLILYFLLLENHIFKITLSFIKKISHIFKIILNILLTPMKFLCKIFNIYVTKARTKFFSESER